MIEFSAGVTKQVLKEYPDAGIPFLPVHSFCDPFMATKAKKYQYKAE
jgi:hypothetical protein